MWRCLSWGEFEQNSGEDQADIRFCTSMKDGTSLLVGEGESGAEVVPLKLAFGDGREQVSCSLWTENASLFCGRFVVSGEEHVVAKRKQNGLDVWRDSCVEVFLFDSLSGTYVNLEMSVTGACYAAHMKAPGRVVLEEIEDLSSVQVRSSWDGGSSWTLQFKVFFVACEETWFRSLISSSRGAFELLRAALWPNRLDGPSLVRAGAFQVRRRRAIAQLFQLDDPQQNRFSRSKRIRIMQVQIMALFDDEPQDIKTK